MESLFSEKKIKQKNCSKKHKTKSFPYYKSYIRSYKYVNMQILYMLEHGFQERLINISLLKFSQILYKVINLNFEQLKKIAQKRGWTETYNGNRLTGWEEFDD